MSGRGTFKHQPHSPDAARDPPCGTVPKSSRIRQSRVSPQEKRSIKAERTCLWNSRHQQIPGLGSRKISQRSEDSLNPDLILYFVLLMCYGSTGLGFCETCFHVGNSCFPSIHASSDDAKSSITRRNIIETLPCNHSFGSIH